MFDPIGRLLLGLVTGIVFGFLLQRGRVAKFRVIVGQFLLRDWTVVKIMGTAVLVGAVGVYALLPTGAVSLSIKPALFGGVIFGGILFGIGMALLGYCPGTSLAACGEGRRDAIVGVLGGLFGAWIFVWLYPSFQTVVTSLGDHGKITLPDVTGISPAVWIVLIALALLAVFTLVSRPREASPSGDAAGRGGEGS